MNSTDLLTFNSAVDAAQLGQTDAAYNALNELNRSYPDDPNVLLWMAFTCGNVPTSSQLIEKVARLDPSNTSLPAARNWLNSQQNTPKPVEAINPPTDTGSLRTGFSTRPAEPATPKPDAAFREVAAEKPAHTHPVAPPSAVLAEPKVDSSLSQPDLRQALQASPPRRFKLKISPVMVMGLFALLIIVLFLAISLPAILSTNIGDMPSPPGGQSLDLSGKDKSAPLYGLNVPKDTQFGAFIVNNTKTAELSKFYTENMVKNGWGTQNVINSAQGSFLTYVKGDKGVVIIIAGPLTSAQINNSTSDTIKAKVKPGDIIVLLIEGNPKDLKLNPAA